MRLLSLNTPAAIVFSGIVIASGIVGAQFVPRYKLGMVTGASTFWRLHVTTGAVDLCAFQKDAADLSGHTAFRCRAEW